MQFYADENFPIAAALELRRLGHDVLTAFEDGGPIKEYRTTNFCIGQQNSAGQC